MLAPAYNCQLILKNINTLYTFAVFPFEFAVFPFEFAVFPFEFAVFPFDNIY